MIFPDSLNQTFLDRKLCVVSLFHNYVGVYNRRSKEAISVGGETKLSSSLVAFIDFFLLLSA